MILLLLLIFVVIWWGFAISSASAGFLNQVAWALALNQWFFVPAELFCFSRHALVAAAVRLHIHSSSRWLSFPSVVCPVVIGTTPSVNCHKTPSLIFRRQFFVSAACHRRPFACITKLLYEGKLYLHRKAGVFGAVLRSGFRSGWICWEGCQNRDGDRTGV